VMGIALPLLFVTYAVLSFLGEAGLGKELFVYRQSLNDIGHFGEWLINAAEVLSVAYLLHLWYVLFEGDFFTTRSIYNKALNSLNQDASSHNCLRELANQDLSERASICAYAKLPADYEFGKI
jgi:hypothetical protein